MDGHFLKVVLHRSKTKTNITTNVKPVISAFPSM